MPGCCLVRNPIRRRQRAAAVQSRQIFLNFVSSAKPRGVPRLAKRAGGRGNAVLKCRRLCPYICRRRDCRNWSFSSAGWQVLAPSSGDDWINIASYLIYADNTSGLLRLASGCRGHRLHTVAKPFRTRLADAIGLRPTYGRHWIARLADTIGGRDRIAVRSGLRKFWSRFLATIGLISLPIRFTRTTSWVDWVWQAVVEYIDCTMWPNRSRRTRLDCGDLRVASRNLAKGVTDVT